MIKCMACKQAEATHSLIPFAVLCNQCAQVMSAGPWATCAGQDEVRELFVEWNRVWLTKGETRRWDDTEMARRWDEAVRKIQLLEQQP